MRVADHNATHSAGLQVGSTRPEAIRATDRHQPPILKRLLGNGIKILQQTHQTHETEFCQTLNMAESQINTNVREKKKDVDPVAEIRTVRSSRHRRACANLLCLVHHAITALTTIYGDLRVPL